METRTTIRHKKKLRKGWKVVQGKKDKKILQIKRKKQKKILFYIMVASLFIFCILLSPVFNASIINITELKKYTKTEICSKINLTENSNTIFFPKSKAENILKKDTYIESVKITSILPSQINIEIKERYVRGYVPYMDSYLYIDEYGRVLEIAPGVKDPLPIVRGLKFSSFIEGEVLDVDNKDSLDVVVKMAQMMAKYELIDIVVEIDVSNVKDIKVYVGNIEVYLGDISNYDLKIRTMRKAIEEIQDNETLRNDRGSLDLRDITNSNYIFKYLT